MPQSVATQVAHGTGQIMRDNRNSLEEQSIVSLWIFGGKWCPRPGSNQ
ncbi:hypothetical protein [Asaia lannensis]